METSFKKLGPGTLRHSTKPSTLIVIRDPFLLGHRMVIVWPSFGQWMGQHDCRMICQMIRVMLQFNHRCLSEKKIGDQYDWTTGVPDNGNDWRKFRVVPRSAFPCFVRCLIGVETEGLLDYQGRAGIISIVRWNLRPVIFGVEKKNQ